jgi:hypothetical protein
MPHLRCWRQQLPFIAQVLADARPPLTAATTPSTDCQTSDAVLDAHSRTVCYLGADPFGIGSPPAVDGRTGGADGCVRDLLLAGLVVVLTLAPGGAADSRHLPRSTQHPARASLTTASSRPILGWKKPADDQYAA